MTLHNYTLNIIGFAFILLGVPTGIFEILTYLGILKSATFFAIAVVIVYIVYNTFRIIRIKDDPLLTQQLKDKIFFTIVISLFFVPGFLISYFLIH